MESMILSQSMVIVYQLSNYYVTYGVLLKLFSGYSLVIHLKTNYQMIGLTLVPDGN